MGIARVGPRLWKTGLAVAIAAALGSLLHLYAFYCALAAATGVAPTASQSLRSASTQISVNLLAGIVGGLAVIYLGATPLVMGGAVMLSVLLCRPLSWVQSREGVIAATLFVMAPHTGNVESFVWVRLLSIGLGSVVGTAVNALILPPNYRPRVVKAMIDAGVALDALIRRVVQRLPEPERYKKADIVADSAGVEKRIAEARRLQALADEAARLNRQTGDSAAVARAIKVLTSMLERILVIHRAALTASQASAYPQRLPDLQAALLTLIDHRQVVYGELLGHQISPQVLESLETIEHQFELPPSPPAGPEEMAAYFQRHRMRSSVSEMANRLSHLHMAMQPDSRA